jgi:hypothetical protein
MGLTVPDAFRKRLTRLAREGALPFEPLAPNTTTVCPMKQPRQGGLKSFTGVEGLMAGLSQACRRFVPVRASPQANIRQQAGSYREKKRLFVGPSLQSGVHMAARKQGSHRHHVAHMLADRALSSHGHLPDLRLRPGALTLAVA